MRNSHNRRRGQSMLESALVLMIFVPVLIGIADFGQFLYLHQTLSDRARAAARWGAVHSYTGDGIHVRKYAMYNDSDPADGATPMLPNMNLGMITATLDDSGTDSARITVTISGYPFSFLSPFMSK